MSDLHFSETKRESIVPQAPDTRYSAYILEKNGDQERYIYPIQQLHTADPPAPAAEQEHLMKRSASAAVPQVHGTLICPGPNGLNETDNNLYDDCMPIPSLTLSSSHGI